MHKYQPRLHVVACDGEANLQLDAISNQKVEDMKRDIVRMFIFPETEFMAVTAYQNHMVRTFLDLLLNLFRISEQLSTNDGFLSIYTKACLAVTLKCQHYFRSH